MKQIHGDSVLLCQGQQTASVLCLSLEMNHNGICDQKMMDTTEKSVMVTEFTQQSGLHGQSLICLNQSKHFTFTQTIKVNNMLVSGDYKGNEGCYCV